MSASPFPDPQSHDFPEWIRLGDYFYHARDIVSFGNELTVDNLAHAYRSGIFPWHIERMPLPWFCPDPRAILEFSDLHLPKSLEKARRRSEYSITIDKDFSRVIESCSRVTRSGEAGTWITAEFISAYSELHRLGKAHSVEVWNADEELVGGLYGVDADGVFCGESMFHLVPNTSKFALLHLIEHLQKRHSTWLDVQVMTPHLKAFGAKDISRTEFLRKLKATQGSKLNLFGKQPIERSPDA